MTVTNTSDLTAQDTLDLFWADLLLDRTLLALDWDEDGDLEKRLDADQFVSELTGRGYSNLEANLASAGRGLLLMQRLKQSGREITFARLKAAAPLPDGLYRQRGEPPYVKRAVGPRLPQPRCDYHLFDARDEPQIVAVEYVRDDQDAQYLAERADLDPAFALAVISADLADATT